MKDNKSVFLDTLQEREPNHKRNLKLDEVIAQLCDLLQPIQNRVTAIEGRKPQWPVSMIIGCPRSGTTLLLQFMAKTGNFAYPSNLLARFAYAPYIGILIQEMIFNKNYWHQNDFYDVESDFEFSSDLGKSKGVLAPNEFFHFWRRFMPNFDIEWLDDHAINKVDFRDIEQELGLIEETFGKPFCMKGLMQQYNILEFYQEMPFLFFLNIKREELYIMQSILKSRQEFYGQKEIWWSAKPAEYEQLKNMDVYHQIAGQVYFTERAITEGLQSVPESNQLTIDYESFCDDPESVYGRIVEKYSLLGYELPVECKGPKVFKCRNEIRLPKEDIDGLQRAYEDFASGAIAFG